MKCRVYNNRLVSNPNFCPDTKFSKTQSDAIPECSGVSGLHNPSIDPSSSESSSTVSVVDKPKEKQTPTVQSAQEYVDIAKRNCDWQTVNRDKLKPKPKSKKKVVIGESKNTCTFQGVTKKAAVCVNRLDPSSTTVMVSDFLVSKGIDVLSCYLVNQNNRDGPCNFVSMRLCVPQPHLAKMLDKDLWPLGITVRPWHFKASQPRQTDSNSV